MPTEHLLIRRMEIMVTAALGHLGAEANWYRIAQEWIDGAEPVTDLGRAEAAARALAG